MSLKRLHTLLARFTVLDWLALVGAVSVLMLSSVLLRVDQLSRSPDKLIRLHEHLGIAPKEELPLGSIVTIAVDGEGRIYVGSLWDPRIQVYDSSGRFLRGWSVPIRGGGTFRILIGPENQVHVAALRSDEYFVYSNEGELLSEATGGSEVVLEVRDRQLRRASDRGGNRYTVKRRLGGAHIVRNRQDGSEEVVVAQPLRLWLISPSVGHSYGMIGLALWYVAGLLVLLVVFRHSSLHKKLLSRTGTADRKLQPPD